MADEILEQNLDVGAATLQRTDFNLDLFLQLNEEYKDKPVLAAPRRTDDKYRQQLAAQRGALLQERVDMRGKRVLEVGCGAGDLSAVLARDYDCKVRGVDIVPYATWEQDGHRNLTLSVLDVSGDHDLAPRTFDRIVSLVVWEHVRHPFSALKACRDLLQPDGIFYLRANLYRSAVASHLYREVFFPWPHLLFPDSVFEELYRHLGKNPKRPSWVNKLTYADYQRYFELLGFIVEREWLSYRPLDEEFYKRFEDVLSRYPIFDLTHEYLDVTLTVDPYARTDAVNRYRPRQRKTFQMLERHYRSRPPAQANLRVERWIERIQQRLPSHLQCLDDPGAALEQVVKLLDTRSYRLAQRLAQRPRGWRYWASLPSDMLRITLSRRSSRESRQESAANR